MQDHAGLPTAQKKMRIARSTPFVTRFVLPSAIHSRPTEAVTDPMSRKLERVLPKQLKCLQNSPAGTMIPHPRSELEAAEKVEHTEAARTSGLLVNEAHVLAAAATRVPHGRSAGEAQRAALSAWLASLIAEPSQRVRYDELDVMATKELQSDLDSTVSARNRLHHLCHGGSLTTRSKVANSAEWQQQMQRVQFAQDNVNAYRDSFVSAFSDRHPGLTWAQIESTVATLCPNATKTVKTIEVWAAEARGLDPVKVHKAARDRAFRAGRAIHSPYQLMIHR